MWVFFLFSSVGNIPSDGQYGLFSPTKPSAVHAKNPEFHPEEGVLQSQFDASAEPPLAPAAVDTVHTVGIGGISPPVTPQGLIDERTADRAGSIGVPQARAEGAATYSDRPEFPQDKGRR